MKLSKKVTIGLMTAVLLIGIMGSSFSVQAATSQNNGLTDEQMELARVVMSSLENYTDSEGNAQIKIINKHELKKQIAKMNTDLIKFKDLEKAVSNFNYYMASGDNAVTAAADDVVNQLASQPVPYGLSCGDILSIIGLIHSGNLALAALLLGVTGPAAFLVPFLVAAAYTAGSVIGCNL
nr:hypothetical protein [uncultured Bacillus sp.]